MASILDVIYGGQLDAHLDRVIEACVERRKQLSYRKFMELEVGQRVKFRHGTRPLYLEGVRGTVISKRQTKVVMQLDHPVGRFYKNIIVNPSSLEVVSSD